MKYITTTIIVVILAVLIVIYLMPVEVKAAALEHQISTVTFNNCKVTSVAYYPNGDASLGGICKGGYWWFTRYSRYLKLVYLKNSYVTIKGVPTTSKRIANAQIAGIGWAW